MQVSYGITRRKLQRLNGFDYSQNNAYFITICAQNRLCLFGEIIDNVVIFNDADKMINEKIESISGNGIFVDKHIVMPNHIHAIILLDHHGTAQGPFCVIL